MIKELKVDRNKQWNEECKITKRQLSEIIKTI